MNVFDSHRSTARAAPRRGRADQPPGASAGVAKSDGAGDGASAPRPVRAASDAGASFRRLPPLNALRTFEAAARHLSFTRAAGELHVTPAAVGQQVRLLEDFVGVPLFHRTSRTLALTDAGEACLPEIREAFERLTAAVARISSADEVGPLVISVAPSLAGKWLLPRLERFEAAHPPIDVRVDASMQVVDLHRSNVDLAIRYGGGRYPGLLVERLMGEAVFPVCSPALLAGEHPLRSPQDIRFHALLHDESPDDDQTCPSWAMWLRAAGIDGVDHSRGPRFNQSSLVLEAAILGRGIALAKARIADADLAAGRVVKPFEISNPVEFAYYVVSIESKARMRKVELFRDWLRGEAAEPG
jgi:LysR family glycine cleavage system transcriptional activator